MLNNNQKKKWTNHCFRCTKGGEMEVYSCIECVCHSSTLPEYDKYKEHSQPSSMPVEKCICKPSAPLLRDLVIDENCPHPHHEASPKVEELPSTPEVSWEENSLIGDAFKEGKRHEHKRVNDILDGMKAKGSYHGERKDGTVDSGILGAEFIVVEDLKHLINNTQER